MRQREIGWWQRGRARPAAIAQHQPRNLLIVARGNGVAQFAFAVVTQRLKLQRKAIRTLGEVTVSIAAVRRVDRR